jgi:hypothetical protein
MTDSNEEIKQAKKLKLLAKFYDDLERIEDGFEMLGKETGKLMLAENAKDNFDSYYKFVQPVSTMIDHIKTTSRLARTTLQEYRQLDDPKFTPKSLWFSPTDNSKPVSDKSASADHQLEKRVDALEFKVQIIIAVLVALFILFFNIL